MKRLLLLVMLWICTGSIRAQEGGFGLLSLGVDATAAALGDAQVAATRDAFSAYWNPAGLAAAPSNIAGLSHQIWIGDVRTYSAAARFAIGRNGALGLFGSALASGDLEVRDGPGPADGTFSIQYVNAGLAYGRRIAGPVRLGVAAKLLRERIYTRDANGFAVDFGLQADLLDGTLRLGAAVQNLGEMEALNNESTPLPRRVRGGVAVEPFRVVAEDDGTVFVRSVIMAEVSHRWEEGETQVHLGAATDVLDIVTVRFGYLTGSEVRGFSAGAGLVYEMLRFDYAFLPLKDGFGGPAHTLSLAYLW